MTKLTLTLLSAPVLVAMLAGPPAHANAEHRTLVVRERAEASLLDGAFTFRLLKMRGYSIDVRIAGERRKLKLGQSFSPEGADCTVTFEENSPETRIARFRTNCP